MIKTIHGDMPADLLEMKTGKHENDNETATWVEYWLKGELVHRSAHIDLKHSMSMTSILESF